MRVAVICAIFLAITVTVIEAESGRRRKMVRGDRGELRSRERKAPRRRIGAEKTSQGETGRKGKQMRRGRKLEGRAGIVVKGNDCEFIYLADITSNSGCSNGQKFVLKGANNTRKQFLIVNDKAIIAFITKRKKFTACESFTDITTSVSCKSVSGLDNITLPSSSSNSSSNSTSTATTASGGAANTTAAASNATTTAAPASNTTAAPAASNTTAAASNATSASNSSGTCKCGIKKTTRIVGGTETEVNEYPWIAAFDFSGTSGTSPGGCAATLISTNWAVTASHCFYNQQGELVVTKDTMSLVLGVHDRTGTTDTNRQVLTIAEIVLHPSYTFSGSSHDIALLKISETVDLDAWSPACLPTSGADFTGQNGWVYGWGATSEGGNLADKLLELEVPIVSDSVCESAMSSSGVTITSDMLCAGGENGKDACGGDSGGPFTVADSGSGAHTLVGAVSFGVGCAREGLYGVYADIPFFRTWIDETIAAKGGATFCS